MLILAKVTDPGVVGIYAWAMLALTLVQAGSDVAARQVAIIVIDSNGQSGFLDRYVRLASSIGPLVVGAVVLALVLLEPRSLLIQTLSLILLIPVPIITARAIRSVALVQLAGFWGTLARLQAICSASSLALSLVIVFLTESLLGAALQVLASELLFFVLVRRMATGVKIESPLKDAEGLPAASEFWGASAYSLLGWSQGQLDRVLVGASAGSVQLGLYTFAWSISRSLGDAIANGVANVLRPELRSEAGSAARAIGNATDRILLKATCLTCVSVLAVVVGSSVVFERLLDETWNPALRAVPVMALATISTVVSWSITVVLVAQNRVRRALPVKILGVVVGGVVAWAATHGLLFAAWVALAREVLSLVLMGLCVGRALPRRSFVLSLILTIALSALFLAEYGLGWS